MPKASNFHPDTAAPPGRVLVTGATGFVGRKLTHVLASMGHRVLALSRQPEGENDSRAGVQWIQGDLALGTWAQPDLLQQVSFVFHCAGELSSDEKMHQLHVQGTAFLLHSLARHAPDSIGKLHWVQLSSVGAYGPPARFGVDRVVTEETPERPVGPYEETKVASDHLVRQAHQAGQLTCAILRPSNVVAVDMPNQSLRAMVNMVKRGIFFHVGRPGAVATYVHVDDVVSALVACGFHAAAPGEVFNLSSDCGFEELTQEIANALNVERPGWHLPEAPLRWTARTLNKLARTPLTESRVDALVNRTRYPATKLEKMLGFKVARPMPAAVAEMVHGWRANP